MSNPLSRFRLQRKPTPYRTALATAEQEMRSRAWTRAADAYERALGLSPQSVELLVQIGHCKKELGEFAVAADYYTRYLAARPDDLAVCDHLNFVRQRQFPSSSVMLQSAEDAYDVSESAGGSSTTRGKALALFSMKCWQQAAGLLQVLCDSGDPEHQDLLCLLGHAHKEAADFAEARRAYQRYLQYALDNTPKKVADAYLQLGHLSKVEGQYREAFNFYLQANDHITDSDDGSAVDIESELQSLTSLLFPTFWPIKSA